VSEQWLDENPFYLVIRVEEGATVIDLGEYQWLTKHAELLRRVATWSLVFKANHQPLLYVLVKDGEQPYYVSRHVGIAGSGGSNEVIAYGIGKKGVDGTMTRLWAIPDAGIICGGDDVNEFGTLALRARGPR
jgi:hypothetical protein